MPTALIFGANGQLGRAMANQLLASGWRLSLAARDGRAPPADLRRQGARAVDATGRTSGRVIDALDETFDAVFDPTAYGAQDAADLVAASGRFSALAVVSSASVYADTQGRTLRDADERGFPFFETPIREDNATIAPGADNYGSQKVAMERHLLDAGIPVTILRPCAVYGVGARHPREWWFVKRALDGRTRIPVAFGAASRFHAGSARGLASLAQLSLTTPGARVLNVADPRVLSVGEIAAAIEAAIGLPVPIEPFPGRWKEPSFVGATPWSAELPFELDVSAARALGWDGGEPYETAVAEVCRWMVDLAAREDWTTHFTRFADYGYDPFDYAAEDRFLRSAAY